MEERYGLSSGSGGWSRGVVSLAWTSVDVSVAVLFNPHQRLRASIMITIAAAIATAGQPKYWKRKPAMAGANTAPIDEKMLIRLIESFWLPDTVRLIRGSAEDHVRDYRESVSCSSNIFGPTRLSCWSARLF